MNPEYYDENLALACLLAGGVCFINNFNTSMDTTPNWNTMVYVMCSDTFMWGCADAEGISSTDGQEGSEIIELYKLWKENSRYGPVKWVCVKRKEQPMRPLKVMMEKDGYWDDVLEALPPNQYDEQVKKLRDSTL